MRTRILLSTLFLVGCGTSVVRAEDIAKPTVRETVKSYQQRQKDQSPQEILEWLQKGNQRFADGRAIHGGFAGDARDRIKVSALSQRPLAAVLSCIDSRTSPELVFDTSVGDLFTARVGANVVNDDILGSLEIAVESGVRVLVVLGHSDCGGVKAACGNMRLGHFTQLLERIKPAIAATNSHLDQDSSLSSLIGERTAKNRKYVREVSHMNELQSARQICRRSSFLREKVRAGELLLISGIYDVDSGKVEFDPAMSL